MFLAKSWWKLSFYWFVSLGRRTPKGRRGLFRSSIRVSILSLSLGVAALSITLALVSGFEKTLGLAVAQAQGHVAFVSKRWLTFDELNEIAALAPPGVERALSYFSSQGLVLGPKGGRGVVIEGRALLGADERPKSDPAHDQVNSVLGGPLAERIGVGKGQVARLLLPGVAKGRVDTWVSDTKSFGMYDLDSRFIEVDALSLLERLKVSDPDSYQKRPGDGHGIRFYLSPNFDPPHSNALENWRSEYLAKLTLARPDLIDAGSSFVTWREQRASVFKGIGYNKVELFVILSLLVLVAALNIAATLVVMYLERDRDMAIIQALGMGPRQLLQWLGVQGLMLGLGSASLGLALGYLGAHVLVRLPIAKVPEAVYNVGTLPIDFRLIEQGLCFAIGTLAALVSALYLGLKLSRMNLVSVLGNRR